MTPSYDNVIGAALVTNTVTVNGSLADREAEYFHREIGVAGNATNAVWQTVTNISGTFTNKGGLLVPPGSQVLTYDADGNLAFDGVWTYQWDGENRLTTMTMTTNIVGIIYSNRLQLGFVYDNIGRRIQKVVSNWNGSSFIGQSTNCFVYDGWNLIAVVNPQTTLLQSFAWGNDISGSCTKAGGIGGLLMERIVGTNFFTTYDGNGNITALVNAADKSLAARYEYSPYGELLRQTGSFASQNPFRFSTKFLDQESGLVYYGARYYCPSLGRWISTDPMMEKGGNNLLEFVLNHPNLNCDVNGKMAFDEVMGIEKDIRDTLDSDLPSYAPGIFNGLNAVGYYDFMEWFQEGGTYDFKDKQDKRPLGTHETFDIGGANLKPDEFGNFLAGYAAGVAFAKTGDMGFVDGTYAGGLYYRGKEYFESPNMSITEWVDTVAGQENMIGQGLIQGVSDDLLGDF